MKIDESFQYPADPDTVVAMLSDPAFQDRKAAASGALRHDVQITPDGAGPKITLSRVLPIGGVPDLFSRFVKDSVEVSKVTEWDAPHGGGRRATVTLTFHAGPMAMHGTMTLEPTANGSAGRLRGDLKCGLPLVGGKAEKALAPQVVKGLRTEVDTGTAWLAERS